jgi:hypothetical protein
VRLNHSPKIGRVSPPSQAELPCSGSWPDRRCSTTTNVATSSPALCHVTRNSSELWTPPLVEVASNFFWIKPNHNQLILSLLWIQTRNQRFEDQLWDRFGVWVSPLHARPFPYKRSPGNPPFRAPNPAIACFPIRRHCQATLTPLELHHQAKKHHRGPLVLPRPSPWTKTHRSKLLPTALKWRRSLPPRDRVITSPPLSNPRWGCPPVPLCFPPLAVAPYAM